jgi:hypothetical protein
MLPLYKSYRAMITSYMFITTRHSTTVECTIQHGYRMGRYWRAMLISHLHLFAVAVGQKLITATSEAKVIFRRRYKTRFLGVG